MSILRRPLALAGVLLLALPACAAPAPSSDAIGAVATPAAGVDLGASSRIPRTQLAMLGTGHEGLRISPSPNVQPVQSGKADAQATGTVNSVDAAQNKVNISHAPIPAIGWPSMTMDFAVAPSVDLSHVKPGTHVDFSLARGKDGMYQVQSIKPSGGAR